MNLKSWKVAGVAGGLTLAAAGGGLAAATVGGSSAASASGNVTAQAYCNGSAVEIVYTVPNVPGLAVSTAIDGRPLSSWAEPASGRDVPVVLGLPSGDGSQHFSITADGRTASAVIPRC